VHSLNCAACHNRDTLVSPRWEILGDEGSGTAPEALPALTWAGEKLRTPWLERFLAGKVDYRPRPTLKSRMPYFPAHARVLAEGLAAEHGVDPAEPEPRGFDRLLAEVGSRLALPTGLDCRQCHAVGREPLTGDAKTQIAVGINFAHARERLREEFYHRFVLDPLRCDPQSKMPKLITDGRTTKVTAVYGGDARRQITALWHFILSVEAAGEKQAVPAKSP